MSTAGAWAFGTVARLTRRNGQTLVGQRVATGAGGTRAAWQVGEDVWTDRELVAVDPLFVVRTEQEVCGACGRPVVESCPSWWVADDELWAAVVGDPKEIRCIPCFTVDARDKGITVSWRAEWTEVTLKDMP